MILVIFLCMGRGKNLGLLKQDGFTMPLDMDASVLGEDIILTETELFQRLQAEGADEA